jgi:hypothetical protein
MPVKENVMDNNDDKLSSIIICAAITLIIGWFIYVTK